MKTFGKILGYGVRALCLLAGLGGDHGALLVGVAILLGMLLGTDTWGLRTRIVLVRMSPQERAGTRARLAVQAQDARAARALQAQQKAQAKRVAAAERALAAAEAVPSR